MRLPPFFSPRRITLLGLLGTLLSVALLSRTYAAEPALRVLLLAPESSAGEPLAEWPEHLRRGFGFNVAVPANGDLRSALTASDVVVLTAGAGARLQADLPAYLATGKPLVLFSSAAQPWPPGSGIEEHLGAKVGPVFAGGSPLSIINLFPHPITGGVARLNIDPPIPLYSALADDVQMIIEGTVGEATAPLAWVRRSAQRRLVHFAFPLPAHPSEDLLRLVGQALLWATQRPIPGAVAQVQRTFMPDAHPGAFAITLPEGPGVCLDPVRGGINYIWDGDFVDLRPRWITKVGEPARIFGPVFYRESAWQPLRSGAPTSPPDYRFLGYRLLGPYPEFHYSIGGREVRETLQPGSTPGSLLRRFQVAPGTAALWIQLEPQNGAELALQGLERDGQQAVFSRTSAGDFSIEIRPKPGRSFP